MFKAVTLNIPEELHGVKLKTDFYRLRKISSTPAFYDGQEVYHWKWTIPLNLMTKCSGDTALITSILAGSLYLLVASESATAGWNLKYHSRVTFDC